MATTAPAATTTAEPTPVAAANPAGPDYRGIYGGSDDATRQSSLATLAARDNPDNLAVRDEPVWVVSAHSQGGFCLET